MKYNKIIIFGLTASGKTTLAKIISKLIKIKVYSTDDFAYKKKWILKSSAREFRNKMNVVLKKKSWIIEGVHSEWLEPAIKKAALVIFLNPPKYIMAKRALKRSKYNPQRDTLEQKLKLIYWIYRWGPSWYRKYSSVAKEFIEIRNITQIESLLKKFK